MFKLPKKTYSYLTIVFAITFYLGLEYQYLNKNITTNTIHAQEQKKSVSESNEQKQEETKNNENLNQENKTEDTVQEEDAKTKIWSLFEAGGPFMWPLLLSSIIGLALVLERTFYFTVHKFNHKKYEQDIIDNLNQGGIPQAVDYINKNSKYLISKILKEGIEVSSNEPDKFMKGVEREATTYFAQAERGLAVLAAISTIAPLIGFLGTVSGMIGAFDAIANADTVNAKVVAGGIKEALITTAAGLIVAIPAMAFFQFFQNKVNNFSAEVETIANHVYKEFLKAYGIKNDEKTSSNLKGDHKEVQKVN